jgi:hypothetical protein
LDILGPELYKKIDPNGIGRGGKIKTNTESMEMRKIMRQFDRKKKGFVSAETHDMFITLSAAKCFQLELRQIKIENQLEACDLKITGFEMSPNRLHRNLLIMTREEMKSFFDPSVDAIVELIDAQVQQIYMEEKQVRV